jgi:hypothetical protein
VKKLLNCFVESHSLGRVYCFQRGYGAIVCAFLYARKFDQVCINGIELVACISGFEQYHPACVQILNSIFVENG